jgi:hypothetical protein
MVLGESGQETWLLALECTRAVLFHSLLGICILCQGTMTTKNILGSTPAEKVGKYLDGREWRVDTALCL